MAKITTPVRFSDHFKIDEAVLNEAGVLDPTLNVDTKLFIDPLLLEQSAHSEIREGGAATYGQYFGTVIKLLRAASSPDHAAWKAAFRLLSFPEIKWTCLGYGGQSVAGSGSGDQMTRQMVKTGKEIVDLGVEDPDLFVAMALFEEGFGPDHICDMAANVILGDLLRFNERVLATLSVPRENMKLRLRNGNSYEACLPVNPYLKGNPPIVLVPSDILRELPIAKDWSEISSATAKNDDLRRRVNSHIAELWRGKSLKDKDELRRWALSSRGAFEDFLQMVHSAETTPYDIAGDPAGEIFWRRLTATLGTEHPFTIDVPDQLDLDGVTNVVEQIIEQFRFLVEDRRFSEELYHDGKPRPEKAAQRLFFAVAYSYCKANNLDITPEADTGNGPVDFKVSKGFARRVVVEIKLSRNGKLVAGYTRQLEAYKVAEEANRGYYLVLDVGQMGEKAKALIATKNSAEGQGAITSPIIFIDGTRKPSASKL
ncbi:MAG TPA: hypothetical protein VGK29_12730 [Paludibaculum sp.]|jgi:hypothetical protein